MDGRRKRWVAHDVYFLDDGLGVEMFDRFGATGIALWHGFIAACKKNHIEGEVTFASDTEALLVFGLPGMPLVDTDGQDFKLDDWLALLSAHKVIRRSRRARRTKVACSKWEAWQQAANRSRKAEQQSARRDDTAEQSGRSDGANTDTVTAQPEHDAASKQAQMTDLDTDTDRDKDKPLAPAARKRDELFEAMVEVCELNPDELTKSARGRINTAVKELRDVGASPAGVRARAGVHRQRWPNAELTPTSLAANYAQLGRPASNGHSRDGPGTRYVSDFGDDTREFTP